MSDQQPDASLLTKATSKQGLIAIIVSLGGYAVIGLTLHYLGVTAPTAFGLGMLYTLPVDKVIKWCGEWFRAEREARNYA